jgi:DNA-binding ferritin-like protein (Dps family)
MIHDVHHAEVSVNAITVRNLPPAVAKAVKERARKEKLSLNKAIIRLLEEATGAGKGKRRVVHHDLDRFFGTWTKEEADAFDEALREQRQIDPEMWK